MKKVIVVLLAILSLCACSKETQSDTLLEEDITLTKSNINLLLKGSVWVQTNESENFDNYIYVGVAPMFFKGLFEDGSLCRYSEFEPITILTVDVDSITTDKGVFQKTEIVTTPEELENVWEIITIFAPIDDFK